ncbi:AraC family transcriptional regulator ligand-binding domain-containing protein [Aeromonas caviae]|uniref:AraC family transcriptional regulator ligand-binding domain-containing protein n=2 Tax=Aeromonadaceae TaxID=84642 RepID=UPI002B47A82D|nr:AraC family transcriptional regulator ligand-binding domain-containing protein [Aeromonas caviae]
MAHKSHFSLDVGWQLLLKDLGLPSRHVLRRALLPEDTLSRENHGLTTDEYFRFWRALEQEANDLLFPLRLIETVSSEVFSPPLFAALCSPDLMRAVQRLAKYKALVAPMSLEISVGSWGDMTLSPRWQGGHTEVPVSLQVVELAFFVRLAQIATREAICAVRVTLPALPAGKALQRYERFFGTAITLGTHASITFSAVDVLRPFLTSNEGM